MSHGTGSGLDERWSALAGRSPRRDRGFRTAALAVETGAGPVLAAVDVDGGRHLLVPLGSSTRPPPDTSGKAVHLLLRRLGDEPRLEWYLDLALMDDGLTRVFTTLCEDVLAAIAGAPESAARTTRLILRNWRALLSSGDRPLDPRALAGLHGELTVLLRLLHLDPAAARWWVGPTGAAHDFVRERRALEIKTTSRPVGRTVEVHGTDQLDGPPGGLLLVWFRVSSRADHGRSVPELVDTALGLAAEPHRVTEALLRLGYAQDRPHPEHDVRFSVVEEQVHVVSAGFPRLVPADLRADALLAGLSDVRYTLDLDAPAAVSARTAEDPESFLLEDQ